MEIERVNDGDWIRLENLEEFYRNMTTVRIAYVNNNHTNYDYE